MKKKKKTINGIIHVKCNDCPKWYPYRRGIARCPKCHSQFVKKYNDRRVFYRSQYKSKSNTAESVYLDREGKKAFSGLFAGCSKDQVDAMINGDVEALLKT